MAKCYIHKGKTSVRNCTDCGKAICRDCVFEERVATRILRSSRYYSEYEHDYDFYCPNCFISYAQEKGFDKGSKGVFFRFNKSPSILGLVVMWSFFFLGFTINFFFPIGYVLYVGTIFAMISLKISASKNYQKYLRSQQLTGAQIGDVPVKKKEKAKEKGNFCPACGANNPLESNYCNTCGSVFK